MWGDEYATIILRRKLIARAAAILDDDERMIGSMIVCDFPSRGELDRWLEVEPYIKGNVWEKVRVHRAQSASFHK